MKTIAVVGSRRRNTLADKMLLIRTLADVVVDGDRLVSGGCHTGADRFAEEIARQMGMTIIIHHADWDKYSKAAGPIRNSQIVADCDVMVALVAADRTGGTEDSIRKAENAGKEVIIV